MIRDKIKNIKHFDDYISEITTIIENGFFKLQNGLISNERLSAYKMHVFKKSWQRCIAKYSAGIPLSDWKLDVKDMSTKFPDYWESSESKVKLRGGILIDSYYLEYYEITLQFLSIAILLDIPEILNKVGTVLKRVNINDILLNYLLEINSEIDETYQDDSVILSVYSDLRKAIKIENPLEQEKLISHFLKKNFYHKYAGWYNSHKGRHATYYGYWSFESAAIVAILDLDDSSFRDNQYYPKDLVDYYRSNQQNQLG